MYRQQRLGEWGDVLDKLGRELRTEWIEAR
jgi:hypothetical protein